MYACNRTCWAIVNGCFIILLGVASIASGHLGLSANNYVFDEDVQVQFYMAFGGGVVVRADLVIAGIEMIEGVILLGADIVAWRNVQAMFAEQCKNNDDGINCRDLARRIDINLAIFVMGTLEIIDGVLTVIRAAYRPFKNCCSRRCLNRTPSIDVFDMSDFFADTASICTSRSSSPIERFNYDADSNYSMRSDGATVENSTANNFPIGLYAQQLDLPDRFNSDTYSNYSIQSDAARMESAPANNHPVYINKLDEQMNVDTDSNYSMRLDVPRFEQAPASILPIYVNQLDESFSSDTESNYGMRSAEWCSKN